MQYFFADDVQVYYHLGAFEDSLTYALGADDLFNVNDTTEYVETTIGKVEPMEKFIKLVWLLLGWKIPCSGKIGHADFLK